MRILTFFLLLTSFAADSLDAQTVTYNLDSGSLQLFNTDRSTLLSGGTAANGDGYALQFGYYTAATSSNPFAGTWVVVAGADAPNHSTLSIGDLTINGAGAGTYGFSLLFSASSPAMPSAGQLMSVRYFNATSTTYATAYGAVSDPLWLWVSPSLPAPAGGASFSLDDPGIVWLNSDIAYTGTLSAVPEPSTYAAIAGFAAFGVAAWRRRRSRASVDGIIVGPPTPAP